MRRATSSIREETRSPLPVEWPAALIGEDSDHDRSSLASHHRHRPLPRMVCRLDIVVAAT